MNAILLAITIIAFLVFVIFTVLCLMLFGYIATSMTPFRAKLVNHTGTPTKWIVLDDQAGQETLGAQTIVNLVLSAQLSEPTKTDTEFESEFNAERSKLKTFYYKTDGKLYLTDNVREANSARIKPVLFGYYHIGTFPLYRVSKFYSEWSSYTGNNDIDNAIEIKSGLIDSFKLRPEFAFVIKDAETVEKQPVNILVSPKYLIVDLTQARFAISSGSGQWQLGTESDLTELARAEVASMKYEDVLKTGKASKKEEFFGQPLRQINNQLLTKFGVVLISIEILNVDFSDQEVGRQYREAINNVAKAEQERLKSEKDVLTAKNDAEASYVKAKRTGDAKNDLRKNELVIENDGLEKKLSIEANNKKAILTAQTENENTVKVSVANNLSKLKVLSLDGKSNILSNVMIDEKEEDLDKTDS